MNKRIVYSGAFVAWTVVVSAVYVCGIRASCTLPVLKLDFITTNSGAQKLLRSVTPTSVPTPTPGIPTDFEVIFLPDQTVYADAGVEEKKLVSLANYMKEKDGVRVSLVGHIANTGAPQSTAAALFNTSLGRNRAEAVKAHLIRLGVSAESVTTSSRTSQEPILDNLTEQARARNRRVDVIITHPETQ